MAKAAVAARSVEFEAIDRLEEKVKALIGVVDRLRAEGTQAAEENGRLRAESTRAAEEITRLRAENSRAIEENTRLRSEVEDSRTRLAEAEGTGPELVALRQERDHIRGRVDQMLKQIDALNL
jgi:regulator of replication initiation timing